MIELPEAYNHARELTKALRGRTVTDVEAAKSKHGFAFYHGDPAGCAALLTGKKVGATAAWAGMVETDIGDARLLFHDGAVPRLYRSGEKRPDKHQLRLAFENGDELIFTVQMYGALFAYPAKTKLDNFYYQVAKESPSPLTGAFDRAHFDAIVAAAKPALSAKGLLATEQRIPGLGNGCAQDILFVSGIRPMRKVKDLAAAELDKLFENTKAILKAMAEQGGRDTERDIFGGHGGYHCLLSAKTYAYPCPRCGGPITRKAYLGGNVYYCEACQK